MPGRRGRQILRRQGRVCDITGLRPENTTLKPSPVRLTESVIITGAGRGIRGQIINRQTGLYLISIPVFDRNRQGLAVANMFFQIAIGLSLHHKTTAFNKTCQSVIRRQAEIIRPVPPIMIAFESKGGAVPSGIMHPNNCTRPRGRAMTDLAVAINTHSFIALFGQFKRGGSADYPCANNNDICCICSRPSHARIAAPAGS